MLLSIRKLTQASLLGLLISTAAMADTENRYITVSGEGEVSAVPDTAWVTSGVNTQAGTAAQALSENNKLMQEMLDVFKDADIEEKHIQTTGFNIHPVYDYSANSNPPKLTGYQVSNSITAKLTELEELGQLLDDIVNAGSNQVSGIQFGFDNDEQLLDQARQNAMTDAMRKAQLYADAVDAKVGDVVSISETGAVLPAPAYRLAEVAQASRMDAGSVPVMKGEKELTATVTVVYELDN